ncbi:MULTISPECIES: chorismate mutase [Methanothermobacter]|jgi:chorismate mutase|uniref:Chorismate mutase, subunit A n=2 Tax=Methanothermobacter thermautotrophicus TaxID=145262 RepID=O26895_METTH|nr:MULTISPECIES: chorismate mutase [Methanothermobacter]MDK2874403.1 chorismate mutase [Methanothermobacter sp.]AAB85304.1 chorismate mutase, subunit A [Methanothermobacter thermautotrophicus str. Delta H]MDN5373487.1 chorismate mutase [Methanothermobacter sp.]WBF07025.1 chorismate mutase [Methanothermobacter thermautotrophicus]BAM69969.1 chorismate mutase [Methanothermobacter sp. CaT2]
MDEYRAREVLRRSRQKIDGIDRDILDLITSRIALAREIAEAKEVLGMEILDPERELQIIERTRKIARENGIDENKLTELMKILMDLSKTEQKEMLRRQ